MAPNSENGGDDNGRILVEWDGPHDPAAPRNWPKSRKWLTSSVGFVFCGCAVSNLVPLSDHSELERSRTVQTRLHLRLWLLYLCLGHTG